MKLLESLLDAIVRLQADALVMHVGDKPYVVTTSGRAPEHRGPVAWGQVELSSRVLTAEAVLGMLGQLLPPEQTRSLQEFGAVEHDVAPVDGAADRFTIVAARSGDDVWLEVRRKRKAEPALPAAAPEAAIADHADVIVDAQPAAAPGEDEEDVFEISLDSIATPRAELAGDVPPPEAELEIVHDETQGVPTDDEVDALLAETAATLLASSRAAATADARTDRGADDSVVEEDISMLLDPPEIVAAPALQIVSPPAAAEPPPAPIREAPAEAVPELVDAGEAPAAIEVVAEEPRQAVILPMSRSVGRSEPLPEPAVAVLSAPIERVLRVAAARGAATVYVVAQSRPMIRVDGEITALDSEPLMTVAEVERLVTELTSDSSREPATRGGDWLADVPDVGRVRCVTFRDHRGPGAIFRMMPPQAISVEQLGLGPEMQALCAEPDGLVLVTGVRSSGKSTLLSAFVDLINRTRSDHVITIEPQISFVHENRKSFVSQREVRADGEAAAAAVRAACREDPDVLVIDDLRTPEVAGMALEAAESGHLVFASTPATSAVSAVERFIEMFTPDRREQAQASLAGALRGVVSQVLLRRVRGGRVAAREVLLNTPAVAALILEGKTLQLPVALDNGRRQGMTPLADAMAALIREGTVHASEAYRKAHDRDALLAALKRERVDTSFAERLA